jgi:hypothetical protein
MEEPAKSLTPRSRIPRISNENNAFAAVLEEGRVIKAAPGIRPTQQQSPLGMLGQDLGPTL